MSFDLFGFIMDRSDLVGRVHFGLASVLKVPNQKCVRSDESSKFDWVPVSQLREYLFRGEKAHPENWTKIVLPYFMSYLVGDLQTYKI